MYFWTPFYVPSLSQLLVSFWQLREAPWSVYISANRNSNSCVLQNMEYGAQGMQFSKFQSNFQNAKGLDFG